MSLENKALNDAFKTIIKHLVPDDFRMAFAAIENIDFSKLKTFSNSTQKYKKNDYCKSQNLNKYEQI